LSLLSKGIRLEDIERGIHGAGTLLRGEPTNLFRDIGKGFGIGCQMDGIEDHWNRLSVLIDLVSDHLIIADEFVSKESVPDPLYLYHLSHQCLNLHPKIF
jgi:hypothetical protein